MGDIRKKYDAALKAKIALEASNEIRLYERYPANMGYILAR